jgi:RNA polymerase sigma factor (sigma-70 family)
VTLVREGYEAAFEEIVRRYGRPLGRYAASIVGNRSEDVLQDAFSKALPALRRDGAEIDLRPWLFRIVRNTALNDLRDSPPSPEALAETIAGGRNPAEELERREELANLIKRLQALPEPQRAAIVMRELEGLGHDEIAAALGLSGGGARQAIYRARQALRDGAGMLVPLPLLKAMLAGAAPGAAEAAAAGAVGAGGAAGAGVALKATAATVLVAGAVGAGVAIDHGAHDGGAKATPSPVQARHQSADDFAGAANTVPDTVVVDDDRGGRDGHGDRRGEDHSGGDTSGHGGGPGHEGNDRSGSPHLDRPGHGGPGPSPNQSVDSPDGHGGHGPGSGSENPSSGSGGSDSGSSGSGSESEDSSDSHGGGGLT